MMSTIQQPKTNYQDFIRDIYNSLKKISQTTTELFTKLETIDNRLTNIETGFVQLSTQIRSLSETKDKTIQAADTQLLNMASMLEQDIYTNSGQDDFVSTIPSTFNSKPIPDIYKLDTSYNIDGILNNIGTDGFSSISHNNSQISSMNDDEPNYTQPLSANTSSFLILDND